MLIVEDEPKMAALVQRGLTEAGFAADAVHDGQEALWRAGSVAYDAIVLDLMLPGMDGMPVCRTLRERGVWSPVLMLTARDAVDDRVDGLDAGADDYLVKPFTFRELLARLRALLRLDPAARRVWRGADELDLTAKELSILELFMRRPGEVLTRLELLEHAWDHAYDNRSNVVDVYVRYLREKIDRPYGRATLQTVRGEGYRLAEGS